MAGFTFAHKLSGGAPTIVEMPVLADAVISAGELVNLESGYVDGAATTDTALVGLALEAAIATGLSNGDKHIKVIIDPDAIYSCVDANARVAGATLDLASGAQGVTTSSNTDVVVVYPSTATEPTHVMIITALHYLTKAL
jgi:hypothetical protein